MVNRFIALAKLAVVLKFIVFFDTMSIRLLRWEILADYLKIEIRIYGLR